VDILIRRHGSNGRHFIIARPTGRHGRESLLFYQWTKSPGTGKGHLVSSGRYYPC
jgi:hypothetical protein